MSELLPRRYDPVRAKQGSPLASLVHGPVPRDNFSYGATVALVRDGHAESVLLPGASLGWLGMVECLQITDAGRAALKEQEK